MNELVEYESPVPAVVVAAEYTSPPVPTASPPVDNDESLKSDEMVDEAVDKKPFKRPIVVEVEL